MSSRDKLRARLARCPADLTWDELVRALASFGYEVTAGAGSRRKFRGAGLPSISLHVPHPGRIVKAYAVRQVVDLLRREGLL